MAVKKKAQVGDIVLVKKNSNSHNYTIGTKYRVVDATLTGSGMMYQAESLDGNWRGNNLRSSDTEFVTTVNVEYFQKQVEEHRKQMEEAQSIIDWMNETGATEYDETEHKVWSVLNAVENDSLSKMERVKIIASLIKA
jgi:hypothetical protein